MVIVKHLNLLNNEIFPFFYSFNFVLLQKLR